MAKPRGVWPTDMVLFSSARVLHAVDEGKSTDAFSLIRFLEATPFVNLSIRGVFPAV